MACVRCGNGTTRRDGHTRLGGQRWRCGVRGVCGRRFTGRTTSAFSGRHFPNDLIALAVRWYARSRLSHADVAEWLAERGFTVDRTAIYRWVQCFLPRFGVAARRHRRRVGTKWRVDETYCDYQGKQAYIYRAIDEDGQVVDAFCSERRNAVAAQAFFARALAETEVTPVRVTTDKAKGSPPALRAVLPGVEHRRSNYLKAVAQGFGGNLTDWMVDVSESRSRSENDRVLLNDTIEVTFADLILQRNRTIAFQADLLDITFVEK